MKKAAKKLSKVQKVRLAIQIFVVVFVFFISISHYLEEKNIAVIPGTASIHAICPFGGVATLYTYATTGDYIQKIHQSDFYMLIGLVFALIITGASFCGWICPLGSIQEWFGKLGRKIFGRFYNKVPKRLDFILRFGKYALLIWIIIQTARTGKLFFGDFDPYYNLFNIWTDEIALTGYISVALTLGLSLLIERPFCRYACPLGAVNGLFNSVSILNIKRKKETCVNCELCDSACPLNVNISGKGSIKSPACIRCMKCVETCPVNSPAESTLDVHFIADTSFKKQKKTFPRMGFGIIAVLAFFIPVVISIAAGTFITERIKTYDTTSDIRGSSTIQEVIDNYDITRGLLYNAFGIPAEVPSETKLKDLSELLGIPEEAEIISPETIREAVDYINLPLDSIVEIASIEEDDLRVIIDSYSLDDSATLKQLIVKSDPGTIAYIISGNWPEVKIEDGVLPELPDEHEEGESSVEIKGSTTLADIKNLVKDFDSFLETMGISVDENMSASMKDLKILYDFEMLTVRDYVEANRK